MFLYEIHSRAGKNPFELSIYSQRRIVLFFPIYSSPFYDGVNKDEYRLAFPTFNPRRTRPLQPLRPH